MTYSYEIQILFIYLFFCLRTAGCGFTKIARDLCAQHDITGWVKNSKSGTIVGKMQGPKPEIERM